MFDHLVLARPRTVFVRALYWVLVELIVNLSAFVLVTVVAPEPTNSTSSVVLDAPEIVPLNLSFVVEAGILIS